VDGTQSALARKGLRAQQAAKDGSLGKREYVWMRCEQGPEQRGARPRAPNHKQTACDRARDRYVRRRASDNAQFDRCRSLLVMHQVPFPTGLRVE
jgi:hypothetical protein